MGTWGRTGSRSLFCTLAAQASVPPYSRSAPVGSPAKFLSCRASAAEIQRTPLRSATRAVPPCGSPGRLPQRPLRAARPAALPSAGAAGPGGPVGARAAPAAQAPAPSSAEAERGGRRSGAGGGAGRPRPPPLPVPGPGTRRPGGGPRTERAAGRSVSGAGRGRPARLREGPVLGGWEGKEPRRGSARGGRARGIRRERRRRTAVGCRRGRAGRGCGDVAGLLPEEVSGYFSRVRCRFPPSCCGVYRRGSTSAPDGWAAGHSAVRGCTGLLEPSAVQGGREGAPGPGSSLGACAAASVPAEMSSRGCVMPQLYSVPTSSRPHSPPGDHIWRGAGGASPRSAPGFGQ